MAERLGEALLDLDTDDRDFNRGVERAGKKADGLGRTFDMVSKKALMLGRNLALAGAAAAGALGWRFLGSLESPLFFPMTSLVDGWVDGWWFHLEK